MLEMVAPGAEARWGDLAIEAEATRRVYVDRREAVRTNLREVTGRTSRAIPRCAGKLSPPSDALLPASRKSRRRALWVAPAGGMSTLHHDGDAGNLNLQIYNRKLFVLIAPRCSGHAYSTAPRSRPSIRCCLAAGLTSVCGGGGDTLRS
jgi:hypothetical protein